MNTFQKLICRTNFVSRVLKNNFFSLTKNYIDKYGNCMHHVEITTNTTFSKHCIPNKKRRMNEQDSLKISQVKNELIKKYNVTFLKEPVKSVSDKKIYLVMKLSNGLTALLIFDSVTLIDEDEDSNLSESDDTSSHSSGTGSSSSDTDDGLDFEQKEKLAACGLTVGVGSFSDPEEIQGLAHFLEHMLFMGSEKFPKENEFDSYVANRGGSDNALTECEHTTFYFDIPNKYLRGALYRFANFFKSPLMLRDSITREREAVESEFQLNLASDSCRIEQLFCSTALLNNPVHKFMWGNLITLQQNISDDDLYNGLRDFWEKNYSAHIMTVAIQTRLPINLVGSWVAQYFGQIPSNFKSLDSYHDLDMPFKIDLFNKIYTVLPIKDKHRLHITWALPPIIQLYKSKPLSYLSFLIGHEGKGSLISYLWEKLWALDLTAGNSGDGIESNSIYSLFSIDINLTDEGLLNIENILKSVFSYIKLLQNTGPVESIFKEMKVIDDNIFQFSEEISSSDNVELLSQNMQRYLSEDYITGDKSIFEYKPDEIIKFLDCMTIDRCNIMILSKSAASRVDLDRTEPWFNTKYNLSDIPKKLLEELRNSEPIPELFLPNPNKYIATEFAILPKPSNVVEYPEKIICSKGIEVWYKQDTKFKLPYGCIKVYMISPVVSSTPKNSVMCDLIVSIFDILSVKETYAATVAGLNHSLSFGDNGLILKIDGFNHKLHLLLETILKEIKLLNDKITPSLFGVIKEDQIKKYKNSVLKPSLLGNELRLSILCNPYWTTTEKLEATSDVTVENFKEFSTKFFEELYVKCLFQGNISKEETINMSTSIMQIINYRPLSSECYPVVKVRKLPVGEKILKVQSFNTADTNCFVNDYYQCNAINTEDSCIVELLMLLLQEPLFNTLRTQEQLGYDVVCGTKDTFGVLGFSLTVKSQADKFKIEHVQHRMIEFLKNISVNFVTTNEFKLGKESLKLLKQQADNHLKEEVKRNWVEIVSDEYEFDRLKKEIKCIESLKKQNVRTFLKRVLQNPGEEEDSQLSTLCLRKLSIQVDGEKLPVEVDDKKAIGSKPINSNQTNLDQDIKSIVIKKKKVDNHVKCNYIQNVEEFKNSLYMFPVKARLLTT